MDAPASITAGKCTAHSSRTGQPCQKWAIKGATVCPTHGGSAPQVKAKAEQRLREMVDPMISRLHDLAMQTDNPKVASECVRDALDRAGIGALVRAKVRASKRQLPTAGSGITVNIGFLSNGQPIEPVTLEAATMTDAQVSSQVMPSSSQVMPPTASVALPRGSKD